MVFMAGNRKKGAQAVWLLEKQVSLSGLSLFASLSAITEELFFD